jgi:hypothetical protein
LAKAAGEGERLGYHVALPVMPAETGIQSLKRLWIPAFERVKESLFSLEGGHRAAMNE